MKRLYGMMLIPACMLCGFASSDLSASTEILLKKLVEIPGSSVKEQKVTITPDGFLRLWKTYPSGKQEYFSFHFSRYASMDYIGTTENGYANIFVADTNVIVQTHHDPQGNIDSMATNLRINFHQCSAEELSQLDLQFNRLGEEVRR